MGRINGAQLSDKLRSITFVSHEDNSSMISNSNGIYLLKNKKSFSYNAHLWYLLIL